MQNSPHRAAGMRPRLRALRALRHRNFQLFFFGQTISLIGTWMTRLATSWLVYRLTESATLLGVVSFAGQIVSFALGPVAGVWVDSVDRRKLLLVTQVAAAMQSLALAALTLTGHITLWHIVVLSTVQGVINAFDMLARQGFLMEMVGDAADLSNAIALNSALTNIARLLGPAIAGFVIAATSEGWCFFIDGLSYSAVIASLLAMHVSIVARGRNRASMLAQMREGWQYVSQFRPVRSVLILFAIVTLMGYPYMVLMPIFAAKVLQGGPHTLGYLSCASGLGALVSAIWLTIRDSATGLARMVQFASWVLGIALVVFGLSSTLWLSLVALAWAGFGLVQVASVSNTILQTLVSEDKRARVLSYYMMAFFGAAPFGGLLAGMLADAIGAPETIVISGVACLGACAWYTRELPVITELMMPIFVAKGLVPVATPSAQLQRAEEEI